jgi:1-deoxy-D-xylulose-5-phosphate synthase
VTFAAGLATQGLRPVVAMYSTFLQRAYDQVVHDVATQNLPVTFCIDRGGLVAEDGTTHHGAFDYAYLRHMPNMVVMAPKDENELQHMLKTCVQHDGPASVRYPRGLSLGITMDREPKALPIGKGELLRDGTEVAIIAIGVPVSHAVTAAKRLEEEGISTAVVNARFVKPLDQDLIRWRSGGRDDEGSWVAGLVHRARTAGFPARTIWVDGGRHLSEREGIDQ